MANLQFPIHKTKLPAMKAAGVKYSIVRQGSFSSQVWIELEADATNIINYGMAMYNHGVEQTLSSFRKAEEVAHG